MAEVSNKSENMELTLGSLDVARLESFGASRRTFSYDKAFFLGAFLAVLQALDGVLTSMGVSRFGVAIEGNPFIRSLMEELGHVTALGLVKALAILIIVALTIFARRLPWINNAMGAIGCVYLFAAIIPWTYILFLKPLF
ncbi:MAG: hypothetical protein KDD69_14795 [Bdellovibrionales bacterium]|nr:hypothetical protein [Bdellovibrionales bacterium]